VCEKSAGGPQRLTEVLQRWSDGDRDAAETVLSLVYDDLREMARRQLRHERREHTLQATALVHEAFLRLAQANGIRFQSRVHFARLFAGIMRRVLVDHARERNAQKRYGGRVSVTLDEAALEMGERPPDLLALDDALLHLAARDDRKAEIVELRFFGGLTLDEVAEAMRLSTATVSREWRLARAWLFNELGGADEQPIRSR
jgi:RNA polymerase sigma factor (TIGR02999 family)